jgi:hypothetical protein
LFFDTTSTYFERELPDEDVVDEDGNVIHPAFRVRGHRKDSRDDLPQVVIGMAVTRDGIPTWRNLRDELQRLHLGTFTGPAGKSQQRTELTARQHQILTALGVPKPPQFLELHSAQRR